MRISARLCLVVFAAIALGCGRGGPGGSGVKLPPPPEVDVSSLSPQSRELVTEALRRLEQNPDDGGMNGHVGMLLHAFNRLEDAAKFYGRARQIAPNSGRWSYYQGVALAERQQVDSAAEAFNANLESWEDHGPTRLRLALLYFEAADLAKSEALRTRAHQTLDKLVEELPDYAPGLIEKARRLAAAGDGKAAADLAQKAIDQGYEGREAHEALAEIYADSGNEEEAGRYEVLASKRPALGFGDEKWMGRITALATTNLGFAERGKAMVKAMMLGPATGEFERAVESGDKELDSRVNLIALYGMQGQIDKAERHYAAALRKGLESGRLHLNMATIRLAQGRQPEARQAYQKAIAIDPFLVKAYQGMSRSNLIEKNYSEAVRWARQAVQRAPKDVKALVELARALRYNGQHDEAVKYFSEAALYSEGKDQIQAMRSMASTQLEAKDYAGATKTLSKAKETAEKAGDNVQALLIESQMGEVTEASGAATP